MAQAEAMRALEEEGLGDALTPEPPTPTPRVQGSGVGVQGVAPQQGE